MRDISGFHGQIDDGDQPSWERSTYSPTMFALYLARPDGPMLSFSTLESAQSIAYLTRLADQALALVSEISTAAAVNAAAARAAVPEEAAAADA